MDRISNVKRTKISSSRNQRHCMIQSHAIWSLSVLLPVHSIIGFPTTTTNSCLQSNADNGSSYHLELPSSALLFATQYTLRPYFLFLVSASTAQDIAERPIWSKKTTRLTSFQGFLNKSSVRSYPS